MAKDATSKDFDHGGFWNSYSSRWEKEGDGQWKPQPGAVLGAEWGDDAQAVGIIERYVKPYLPPRGRVLEIGPGGGKFSRLLDRLAGELILADIAKGMLERTAASLARRPRTLLLDGTSLAPEKDGSIDFVFSYDVFIHLESEEIFRYFAEANRVLVPQGHFLVHTSTLESTFGFHAYFRQLRDHQADFGRRYGGRMYPITLSVFRRFAEHCGFEIVDQHGDFSDRDIVLLLRKTHPAWTWRFATVPELYSRFEICERVGGTPRRALFSTLTLASSSLALALVGGPKDAWLAGAGSAKLPAHPCLPAPTGFQVVAGAGIAFFEFARGPKAARLFAGENFPSSFTKPAWRMLLELLDGVQTAHAAGFVHGEISGETILYDIERVVFRLVGFMNAEAAGADFAMLRARDREAMAAMLLALPVPASVEAGVKALAQGLAKGEVPAGEIARLLGTPGA